MEALGDIILGSIFPHCHHSTQYKDGRLVLIPSPIYLGRGGLMQWGLKEEKDGWTRTTTQTTDLSSVDPSRAAAKFIVVSVKPEPASDPGLYGRDAGYGGGTAFRVKRLADDGSWDPNGEEIIYHRKCTYSSDAREHATVVGHRVDLVEEIIRTETLASLTPAQRSALGV